ncbi:acyl carrier protein, partial [Streptomyces sp. DH12]|uniref:acyl carrier protein n=1 Tax=Streptomyces sp. DH12 TaxID=2857010 RepID=UPI001E379796
PAPAPAPPSADALRAVRTVWADLLGEAADDAQFFEAGGDSILAMQMVSRLRREGFSLALRDSSTMVRRNLLHARRYPSLTLNLLLTPVMLLLLFVYVFGDVMSAGLGGGGRSAYVAYLVPGLLLMT